MASPYPITRQSPEFNFMNLERINNGIENESMLAFQEQMGLTADEYAEGASALSQTVSNQQRDVQYLRAFFNENHQIEQQGYWFKIVQPGYQENRVTGVEQF